MDISTTTSGVVMTGSPFGRVEASGAEIVQEPTEEPYGVRDGALRDPAGNLMRIQALR
jgi:uncharacterized glyoxalase superfamily protein PhnB